MDVDDSSTDNGSDREYAGLSVNQDARNDKCELQIRKGNIPRDSRLRLCPEVNLGRIVICCMYTQYQNYYFIGRLTENTRGYNLWYALALVCLKQNAFG